MRNGSNILEMYCKKSFYETFCKTNMKGTAIGRRSGEFQKKVSLVGVLALPENIVFKCLLMKKSIT